MMTVPSAHCDTALNSQLEPDAFIGQALRLLELDLPNNSILSCRYMRRADSLPNLRIPHRVPSSIFDLLAALNS